MTNRIVNDFSIIVGTENGSGSATSNNTLLRALFKMGIPVSGKNLFPSNIQGLPTWYTIRVSKDGFTARREEKEVVVSMNAKSFAQDLATVAPGGAFFYDDSIKFDVTRDDITAYPMPVKQIIRNDPNVPANLRGLISNMVYVGIVAQMLGIDLDKIKMALDFHFKNKQKPIDLNFNVVKASAEWAAANLEKKDPFFVEPMDKTEGLIMADGNMAAAIGTVYGGVQFCAWYPITPATSLAESLNDYLPLLRKREDGKNTYAVLQAEDELAAIGMLVGAGWSGLRAMTSTSGPGLSLMTEFMGLAYFAEVPLVVWDVQRVGPSTGLPTRTQQGDVTFAYHMGHGDTEQVVLFPGSVNECFEFGWKSFDIAERVQGPVIVLTDLDFGMNQWMTEPFRYPDTPMDRGKLLWEEDIEKLAGDWGRYRDVDDDGIPYRTFPGNKHPLSAYFTRGTGHDQNARYSEDAANWAANMERLKKKYITIQPQLPAPIIEKNEGAQIGIIAYGSTQPAVFEARHQLDEQGVKTSSLRLRAIPFTSDVMDFIASHERVYIVDMNRDGQMYQLLVSEHPEVAAKLRSIAFSDGMPATAKWVRESILEQEAQA